MTATALGQLQLMWLASPALPVGGFSYSEGLEAAVDAGLVTSGEQAADWLLGQLWLSQARGDLAVLAQAIPAWRSGDLACAGELNAWVLRTRETAELRQQSQQMGRSLLEWLRQLPPWPGMSEAVQTHILAMQPWPPTWPVAFALAAAQTAAPVRDCLLAGAFAWAENMVQSAIKAVPLGQTAGQRILARLVQAIPAAVDHALHLPDDQRQAFTPMLAILSARHETQYSRLFRS